MDISPGKAHQVKKDKDRYLAGPNVGFQLHKSRARIIKGAESTVGINADVCQAVSLRVLGQSGFLLVVPTNNKSHRGTQFYKA